MTNKITEFLQSRSDHDRDAGVIRSRQARIEKWRNALDALYMQIESWLRESVDAHAASLARVPMPITEESFGSYPAEKLLLTVGGQTLSLIPRGAFVLGADGRVDLQASGGQQVILVLIDGSWRFTPMASRQLGTTLPLFDEDGFLAVLQLLLGESRD